MAISINVLDLDHRPVDIMVKYQGSHLLIIFYNNTCLGCTGRAIPLAYQYHRDYKNLQVIGIHSEFGGNLSTKEDIASIFTIEEVPFPIYIDPELKMYDRMNAEGTPHWVLINKEGEVFRSFFGSLGDSRNRLSYAVEAMVQ